MSNIQEIYKILACKVLNADIMIVGSLAHITFLHTSISKKNTLNKVEVNLVFSCCGQGRKHTHTKSIVAQKKVLASATLRLWVQVTFPMKN